MSRFITDQQRAALLSYYIDHDRDHTGAAEAAGVSVVTATKHYKHGDPDRGREPLSAMVERHRALINERRSEIAQQGAAAVAKADAMATEIVARAEAEARQKIAHARAEIAGRVARIQEGAGRALEEDAAIVGGARRIALQTVAIFKDLYAGEFGRLLSQEAQRLLRERRMTANQVREFMELYVKAAPMLGDASAKLLESGAEIQRRVQDLGGGIEAEEVLSDDAQIADLEHKLALAKMAAENRRRRELGDGTAIPELPPADLDDVVALTIGLDELEKNPARIITALS